MRISINDMLQPISETSIKNIKKIRFDPDSPRFAEAVTRLGVSKYDLQKRKLSDFMAEIKYERPHDADNEALVFELARIRMDYYLMNFRTVFNDVLEERAEIKREEQNELNRQRQLVFSQGRYRQMTAHEVAKSAALSAEKKHKLSQQGSTMGSQKKSRRMIAKSLFGSQSQVQI